MKSMEQGSGDGCLQPCLFGLNIGYEFNKDFAFSRTSSEKLLTKNVLGGGGGCYRSQERFWYRGGLLCPGTFLLHGPLTRTCHQRSVRPRMFLGRGKSSPLYTHAVVLLVGMGITKNSIGIDSTAIESPVG